MTTTRSGQIDDVVHPVLDNDQTGEVTVKSMTEHVGEVLDEMEPRPSEEEVHSSMNKWGKPHDKHVRGGKIKSGKGAFKQTLDTRIDKDSSIPYPPTKPKP